ncbi:unnamed protein product [Schistosoma margrebowiei]|uniref:Uncharacterized protein n=1 Tax=Schistosoma margrebowiei TaxID=48269 RepID=A0A183MUI8_9TREM|nr:unnamed protein product [Schistosoma margrebowiei]
MVIDSSQQETLDLGFVLYGSRQQGVPVILRDLMLPDRFNPMSPSFLVRSITTGLIRVVSDLLQASDVFIID